jgi:outer membrane protein assembly factor BamE
MPISFRHVVSVCACLALSACFLRPYRIDVQQGNYIDREVISKLKVDMTRAQVKFLLGTPLIADPFNPNRWDYLYYNRPGSKIKDVRRLTLYFDGDRLKRAYADAAVAPLPGQTAAAEAASTAATPRPAPTPAVAPDASAAPTASAVSRTSAPSASDAQLPSLGTPSVSPKSSSEPLRSPLPGGRGTGTW